MASSVSGQDESNPALWLATRAARWSYLARSGLPAVSRKKNFPESHIVNPSLTQACSVEMAEYWPRFLFASLWTSTTSRSINSQKKNVTNIQPSWPHTWSITHIRFVGVEGRCQPCGLKVFCLTFSWNSFLLRPLRTSLKWSCHSTWYRWPWTPSNKYVLKRFEISEMSVAFLFLWHFRLNLFNC